MKREPRNPDGRAGKPLKIPLPFDDALAAALETPPPAEPPKVKKRRKKAA